MYVNSGTYHCFRICSWRSDFISRTIILLFMLAVIFCFEMIALIILSVFFIFTGVNTMIDRFSCKHNESNVNNDNEHDDYVEDDTDLSMMLFQKEN